jgi:hypothetical protein
MSAIGRGRAWTSLVYGTEGREFESLRARSATRRFPYSGRVRSEVADRRALQQPGAPAPTWYPFARAPLKSGPPDRRSKVRPPPSPCVWRLGIPPRIGLELLGQAKSVPGTG